MGRRPRCTDRNVSRCLFFLARIKVRTRDLRLGIENSLRTSCTKRSCETCIETCVPWLKRIDNLGIVTQQRPNCPRAVHIYVVFNSWEKEKDNSSRFGLSGIKFISCYHPNQTLSQADRNFWRRTVRYWHQHKLSAIKHAQRPPPSSSKDSRPCKIACRLFLRIAAPKRNSNSTSPKVSMQ